MTTHTTKRGTTRILLASTLYGAATLAAAMDAGRFTPADRTLLLIANNAATPETTPAVDEMPGFEQLRDRFDGILSWNEAISPFHPGSWSPRTDDIPLWERYLRLTWDLGDDSIELAVESIQVNPAMAVAQIFAGAPVDVYADGLMSYGPTRNKIDPLIGTRVRRLLHLDLVPGLKPLLLTEFGVGPEVVPTEVFLKVLADLCDAAGDLPRLPGTAFSRGMTPGPPAGQAGRPGTGGEHGAGNPYGPALLLGQYLSALGILTADEEEDLHVRMMRGAAQLGHKHVVFKPHPTAPARWSRVLEKEAQRLGVELTVLETPVLAEVLYQRMRPVLVVGCFSTALLTASALYGIPVARIGTSTLLDRLTPYQNSNRVPVTIVDALLPDLADRTAVEAQEQPLPVGELDELLRAVGYAMQAKIYPELRRPAERYLAARLDARTWRYFKRRRLTSLALPGAIPSQFAFIPRNATVRRVAKRARSLKRSALKRAALG
ncbi:polysialyltransferase family glycosyltransferase [Streptomyces sp. NPDC102360]|uniref:polysialyltransferase family glycosyltransferase n=1 Tax=Streptomyces sp. NPDC102360 TaxID=3366160 RepID=UPI0037FD31A9